MKILRALVSLLWAALCSCCLFARLRVLEAVHRNKGTLDSDEYRDRFTEYQSWFSDILLRGIVWGLGLTLTIDTGGLDLSQSSGPLMVVSNHGWIGDPLFVYRVLRALGVTKITWVMKRSLETSEFGRAAKQMGAAFVGREGGDSGDRTLVERAARWALEHAFALLIFLEGTRKKTVPPNGPFRRLLPPKLGGLRVAARAMPDAPFVAISIRWSGDKGDLSPSTTAWWGFVQDLASLVGLTVTLRARLTPRSEVGDPDAWALRTWTEMDEWLGEEEENT